MTAKINILLTSAGRRVPIINEFKKALAGYQGITGKVITVDMDPLSAGLYTSDGYHIVPAAKDNDYIPVLLDICKNNQIDAMIPTTDEELLVLAREKARFLSQGTRVIVSDYETINICNDKMATFKFLKINNIPVPVTYLPEELPPAGVLKFPLFIKPRNGKGSVDCYQVHNYDELQHYEKTIHQPVIQQFIKGPEYTADVMCDFSSQIITVVPRERIATSSGVTQKGLTVGNQIIEHLAAAICRKLKVIGAANIQFIVDENGPQCIEINPRFSGGISLTLAAGAKFPNMLIDMLLGKKVPLAMGKFEKDLIMLRYDAAVFIKKGKQSYEKCNLTGP